MSQAAVGWTLQTRNTLFNEIREILDGMPPELREVFTLSHYNNKSAQEIAKVLGLHPAEVSSRLSQANRLFFRSLHQR
jgi:RNA polymerase sigma factor (sigma-70 family)